MADLEDVIEYEPPEPWDDSEVTFVNEIDEITSIPKAFRDEELSSDDMQQDTDVESEVESEVEVPIVTKFLKEKIKRKYKNILSVEDDFL